MTGAAGVNEFNRNSPVGGEPYEQVPQSIERGRAVPILCALTAPALTVRIKRADRFLVGEDDMIPSVE
jgi:hypothetical protein